MDLATLSQKIIEGKISNAAIDSRAVKEGGLFFALAGEKTDGHLFLAEVAHRKAAIAVVSSEYRGEDFGLQLVRVEDVLVALHKIAQKIASERKSKKIGVTGSVGKTTMKEFLATVLNGRFSVQKTPKSYNSQATFPLNLLNFQEDPDFLVLEMGMSQRGEIARLVEIAPPDIALIGRIGLAHAAYFPEGLEAIAAAKAEILSNFCTAFAVVHAETLQYSAFKQLQLPVISYGKGDYLLEPYQDLWKIIERGEESPPFNFPIRASHFLENFLGAAALARTIGLSWEEIFEQIPKLSLVERRFEKIKREGIFFINDAYNANPTSMKAALENLPAPQEGARRIFVMGEMQPLGIFSIAAHEEIGAFALAFVDELFCFGPECLPAVDAFAQGGKPVRYFSLLEPLKEALFQTVRPGDVVLIKGSNTKQMWKLFD